jgi:hypothetical protein
VEADAGMTLDQLFADMKRRGVILVSPSELYEDESVTPRIRYELKRHTAHIETLLRLADIRVCPNRDLHRRYWIYRGQGCYVCSFCEEFAALTG